MVTNTDLETTKEFERLFAKAMAALEKLDNCTASTNGFARHNYRINVRRWTERLTEFEKANGLSVTFK